jgi:hypothetical protein
LGSAGTITVAGRIALDDSLNSLVGSLPDGWAPGARAARGAGGVAENRIGGLSVAPGAPRSG